MISLQKVKKQFKTVTAVNDVSLEIVPGDFIALLGPNGAGKTTLMEMIEGIQLPDSGTILIRGMNWKNHAKKIRSTLGISFQETFFIETLTVIETLQLFASFYTLDLSRCEEVLKLINLQEKRKAYIKTLSGGQKQRLALGVALLNKPEVLLLDEPTTGLDPTARREIWEILHRLRSESGITMILTTHYMEEAEFLCERIIIMDKGNILTSGTLTDLLAQFNASEIISFDSGDLSFTKDDFPIAELNKIVFNTNRNRWELFVKDSSVYLPHLLDEVHKRSEKLTSLECRKMTLDDIFVQLTGRSLIE